MKAAGAKIANAARRRAFQVVFSRTQSGARNHVAHNSTSGIGATVNNQLAPINCISSTQLQSTPLNSRPQNPARIPLRIIIEAHWPAEYEIMTHDKYISNGER